MIVTQLSGVYDLGRASGFLITCDEPEPHPAYDFFAPRPLLGYAGNQNKNNGWIETDVPLLEELRVVSDEPMVGPIVDEITEPIVEAEEQGFDEEDVREVNEEWLMAPVTPPSMPAVPPSSVYEVGGPSTTAAKGPSFLYPAPGLPVPPSVIEDLSTRLGNLEYRHRQLVQKVIQVQVMTSYMVHVVNRFEQISTQVEQGQQTATQRDETMVLEISCRESTLMQCIIEMDIRLIDLERRPPGPQ
nr:hypothetical protein [Tanacetum cinerariifolium]